MDAARHREEWSRAAWIAWHVAASMPRTGDMPSLQKYIRAATGE